jgi:HlyD family secretion protein
MNTSSETGSSKSRTRRPNRLRAVGAFIRKLFVWALGLALVAAVVAGFWPKPMVVDTAEVVRGSLTVSIVEEGKTHIRNKYVVAPPVSGYLHRVMLRAGAPVVAGETVLATLDGAATGFLDPKTRAEATARIAVLEAITKQRGADIERVNVAIELADAELARLNAIPAEAGVSKKEFDAAENKARLLRQELKAVEFAHAAAELEVSQARTLLIQVLEPGSDGAAPLELRSPISGVVLTVFEESARTVSAGTPIIEIADPSDLEIEVELLSVDAAAVTMGTEVLIEQWGGDAPLRARVSMVEPGGFTKLSALGVEEQRVIVRLDLLDELPADRRLGDGYRVAARVIMWRGDGVLLLPEGALFRRGNKWFVFLAKAGKAVLAEVQIGHSDGRMTEVLDGVAEGVRVIMYPADELADGAEVSVLEKRDLP